MAHYLLLEPTRIAEETGFAFERAMKYLITI